jgi:regulator of sigma E protease
MPQILAAIFGLSLLVTLHEAGHYLFARFFGMRVLRFSIGFGPVLASYKPKNSPTVFQVCDPAARLRAGRRHEPRRGA